MATKAIGPTDRLRHFLATTDDYEDLRAAHALPVGVDLHGFEDRETRWVVRLHALVLRKYFAPRDSLFLPKLVDHLRQCAGAEFPVADWTTFRASAASPYSTSVRVFSEGGTDFDEAAVLVNELYGRFLHGDYEKRVHAHGLGERGSDALIYMATWNRATHVTWFADFVRHEASKGTLTLEP